MNVIEGLRIRGVENDQIICKTDMADKKILASWVVREATMINMMLQEPAETFHS